MSLIHSFIHSFVCPEKHSERAGQQGNMRAAKI